MLSDDIDAIRRHVRAAVDARRALTLGECRWIENLLVIAAGDARSIEAGARVSHTPAFDPARPPANVVPFPRRQEHRP